MTTRGLRDVARHLGAALPHGRALPEGEWRARHRVLLWLLWAHAAALPVVALLFGHGLPAALLDGAIVGVWAVLAQLRLGGRRVQSLIVTIGLLTASALLVHIADGRAEAYFHFFVMVAALSLYEDWVPFGAAVAYVLVQHWITAAIVDYDHASSPWLWALVHSAFVGALSVVLLVSWRASERNREAFRSLVESLDEGVLLVDAGGRLVTANPSAERILGVHPARATEDWAGEWPLRATAATGRPVAALPVAVRRPDGSTRWLSVSTRAVEPERDPPYAVVVSFSDVTEQRDAAEQLRRSNAELAQFAYVASHDLSEPLRMVSSYLNLLRRRYRGRLDEDADEFIEFAVDGAGRMRGLIEALLAYSRAGSGDEPERVELGSVTADVLRSLAAALVDAGAEIEIGDLPAVMGDRSQLEQLLQNLVANALKFRTEGGARVWVYAAADGAAMTQVSVADGGIGIAPEQREQVFEMFGRAHDGEGYAGTGIGLAVCRKIVERHGGRIWIEDRAGGGTVFRFTLPVA